MNFSSGLRDLDQAVGLGDGFPPGKLVHIHGSTDSGKTALALWFARVLHREDPDALAGWTYTETPLGTQNLEWAGVDPSRLLVVPPVDGYSSLDLARHLVEGGCRLVVLDSLAGLLEDRQDAVLASGTPLTTLISRGIGQLARATEDAGALVLLLNQQRNDGRRRYPAGEHRSLRRQDPIQIGLSRGENLMRAARQTGFRVRFHVDCGEADPTARVGRFNLYYDGGLVDLRRVAVEVRGEELAALHM
jgi:energy-coupling factor transporter ATP-binding protein EcfA2